MEWSGVKTETKVDWSKVEWSRVMHACACMCVLTIMSLYWHTFIHLLTGRLTAATVSLVQVCETCFGVNQQSLGVTRSHLGLFLQLRSQCQIASARRHSVTGNCATLSRAIRHDRCLLCASLIAMQLEVHSFTIPCCTLPYLTLPYLTGKACYRLVLRPPVGYVRPKINP